ncbi:MAG: hypothetical protein JRF33_25460 [Deltaproteobacteria bacterium]|nr:hypothetical protein [Deltaproteobacteria bacterium]
MKTFRCMALVILVVFFATSARAGFERDFAPGSLIIPMDLSYQDHGTFQAYGLVFQLLRNGITVYWTIDPEKVWHAADCDTGGDECDWDCAEEGSGVKCPYPTASPDFYVATSIVWDGEGEANPGDLIANHGYRGGPFVIDSADAATALDIINAWNDESLWGDNPWAQRTVFNVVSVHENTAAFSAYVRKEMVAAPTIAVFADGNEDIATKYLRAAGIPQSNGMEFPASICGPRAFRSPTAWSFRPPNAAMMTAGRALTTRTCLPFLPSWATWAPAPRPTTITKTVPCSPLTASPPIVRS